MIEYVNPKGNRSLDYLVVLWRHQDAILWEHIFSNISTMKGWFLLVVGWMIVQNKWSIWLIKRMQCAHYARNYASKFLLRFKQNILSFKFFLHFWWFILLFIKLTDDIQILAVHIKEAYNFVGMIWWHSCLSFLSNYAFFENWFQILAIFCAYARIMRVIAHRSFNMF